MHPVFLQAIYYGFAMTLTIFFIGVLLKGFLGKYVKVRLSFGKFVLVKIRSPLRDYYQVGEVEEGFLVYKHQKSKKRLSLKNCPSTPFYKSIAVLWIDVDEEKNAINMPDYKAISGYDAVKFDDLLKRALQKPVEKSNMEKVIIVMLVLTILVAAAAAYFSFSNTAAIQGINSNVANLASQAAGKVVGSAGTI